MGGRRFSVYESKGVFAVLLGPGLSRAAEIPTGWEITLSLIRRVGLAQGAEEADRLGRVVAHENRPGAQLFPSPDGVD